MNEQFAPDASFERSLRIAEQSRRMNAQGLLPTVNLLYRATGGHVAPAAHRQ
jgi:hypothetical protein